MKQALLIIHAGENCVSTKFPLPHLYQEIFDRIADELMPQRRIENFLIYALPESTKVYKRILAQDPIQIPYSGSYPYQCLKLKEELLNQEVTNTQIVGVRTNICITEALQVMHGERRVTEFLKLARKKKKIPSYWNEEFFQKRIESKILYRYTD